MNSLLEFDNSYNPDEAKKKLIREWEISSQSGLEKCNMETILPIIKLGERKTYPPWDGCHFPGLIVKLQDLITDTGKGTKPVFDKIRQSGGLHNFLDYSGKIILSSIMTDKAIGGLSLERHADIINSLTPDYHITPDGETYLNEKVLSAYEIKRMMRWTEFIFENCTESKPIGLVKGSCLTQVEDHTEKLSDLGLDMFVFHAGDYISKANGMSILQARNFYAAIRKMVPWLMIYGVGSEKYIRMFKEADCYAPQSHFIRAFYGQEIGDLERAQNEESGTRGLIIHNLKSLESIMIEREAVRMFDIYETDSEGTGNGIVIEQE